MTNIMLPLHRVLQPYVLECIRFRLPEHVDTFHLRNFYGQEVCVISLLEIATMIRKMFNITPEVSEEQSLEQQGREHSLQYSMKQRM
jgi:hypothetical protein